MKALSLLGKYRNTLVLVAALALGAFAAYGMRGYISEQLAIERERLMPNQPTTPIVVAKRDLPKGEAVDATSMAVREIPKEFVPASAITAQRFEGYAGARLVQPMRAGEPLIASNIEGADPASFSAKVRQGIRAITLAVDEVNSLSGMLQPGDRIDLLLSVRLPSGSTTPLAQEVTRPLLQDLRVLATGRQVRPGADERQGRAFTAITVEATAEQAQKLVVAQRIGKLTATLRNPEDRSPVEQRPMDVYGLLDLKPLAPPPPPVAPTEIIVGGQGAQRGPAAPGPMLATVTAANALVPAVTAVPNMPSVPAASIAPAAPVAAAQPAAPSAAAAPLVPR
ncbi:MAG: Flp pilus assembly protein CpaB [Burkholderiaceae bacterium]|nr:Flp pilus assembly protein CpaB [Burkholderiaceae bacterium]